MSVSCVKHSLYVPIQLRFSGCMVGRRLRGMIVWGAYVSGIQIVLFVMRHTACT